MHLGAVREALQPVETVAHGLLVEVLRTPLSSRPLPVLREPRGEPGERANCTAGNCAYSREEIIANLVMQLFLSRNSTGRLVFVRSSSAAGAPNGTPGAQDS